MDTQKITCFLETVNLMSFTKAAERLFVSQSTISRNIRALEAELNLELFVRNSKNVELTEAGKIMADGLPPLLDQLTSLQKRAAFAQQGYTGEIRIGILQEFMLDDFPYALSLFEIHHPDIHVVIQTLEAEILRQKFLSGDIDFFMGGADALQDYEFPSVQIGSRMLGLAVTASHPFADSTEKPRLIDFQNDTFVTMPNDVVPARRNLFLRCAKAGFVPKEVLTAQDLPTIMLMVELGRGISFLYENSSIMGNKNIRLLELDDLPPIPAMIYWNENSRSNARSKKLFAEYISNYNWMHLPQNIPDGTEL